MIEFIVKQWPKECAMVGNKVLYANIASKAYKITIYGYSREKTLDSDQQEADTRLLLHAKHSDEAAHNILISAPVFNGISHYFV